METMDVMNNGMDEVMVVAEDITPKTGSGLKVAGGVAVGLAVGYGIYKGVKWIGGKLKAKKEQERIYVAHEVNEIEEDDVVE